MIARRCLGTIATTALALLISAGTVSAQTTTATVSGSLKDAQGGVIPGATVTLISESRGTRVAPAVSNSAGDYVFANVAADTYTIEVTMSGFKTLKRNGSSSVPRPRPGRILARSRRPDRDRRRQGRRPGDPGPERRTFVHGHDRVGRESPLASRSFTALARSRRA